MNPISADNVAKSETSSKYKILIVSSIEEDWGGSEELWAKSIPALQGYGFQVYVMKKKINRKHAKFIDLEKSGVILEEFLQKKEKKSELIRTLSKIYKKIARKLFREEEFIWPFTQKLLRINPDLVVIAQGINFDGLGNAFQCAKHHVPYVVIAQKAVDFYWPEFYNRPHMIDALKQAERCFFVSRHNQTLTEEQFGLRLSNAQVIHNPVKMTSGILPFPSVSNGYHLACIGRLFVLDKGQDILLRILAKDKWKSRPLRVSFIGTGGDAEGLQAMAKLLDMEETIEFIGHVDDIEELWRTHHALVLPSRSEGLPLSMIEAMAAGRPVIVSDAGGNAEVVEDGVNGFIGFAHEKSFEDAMERAWKRREGWQQIGLNGAAYVSGNIPASPETEFASYLMELFHNIKKMSSQKPVKL